MQEKLGKISRKRVLFFTLLVLILVIGGVIFFPSIKDLFITTEEEGSSGDPIGISAESPTQDIIQVLEEYPYDNQIKQTVALSDNEISGYEFLGERIRLEGEEYVINKETKFMDSQGELLQSQGIDALKQHKKIIFFRFTEDSKYAINIVFE